MCVGGFPNSIIGRSHIIAIDDGLKKAIQNHNSHFRNLSPLHTQHGIWKTPQLVGCHLCIYIVIYSIILIIYIYYIYLWVVCCMQLRAAWQPYCCIVNRRCTSVSPYSLTALHPCTKAIPRGKRIQIFLTNG